MLNSIANMVGFRNANHLAYFLISFNCIVFTTILVFKNKDLSRWPILIFLAVLHFLTTFLAIDVVFIKKWKSNVYSKDCIWYNALLGIGYLSIYFVS